MAKLKILNCEPSPADSTASEPLRSYAALTEKSMSRSDLLQSLKDYDGLMIKLGHFIDEELLEKGPKLKFIATCTTGTDHIDTNALQKRNIHLLTLKDDDGYLEKISATAEHTWALLLSLVRHLPEAHQSVIGGEWQRNRFSGRELMGHTLGILGLGRLGLKVARYANAFNMKVMAFDPYVEKKIFDDHGVIRVATKEELLAASDIVSLHLHLNEETRNIMDARSISLMKKGGYLINTSRGGLIDENALAKALKSGHLGGAAVDVLEGENRSRLDGNDKWVRENPLVEYAQTHRNLLITPHIGGLTAESLAKAESHLANKIISHIS